MAIQIGDHPELHLVELVQVWFSALANGQWGDALAMLDEPNSYGITWTQDRILFVLNDTFGPGTRFFQEHGSPVFSDPATARGHPHRTFGELNAGGFWLDHAVPLNGEYSDLTAQFEFVLRRNGFSVILQDLHVL